MCRLTAQLKMRISVWVEQSTSQVELTSIEKLRGTQLLMSGQMHRLIESSEIMCCNFNLSSDSVFSTAFVSRSFSHDTMNCMTSMMQVDHIFSVFVKIITTRGCSLQRAKLPFRLLPQEFKFQKKTQLGSTDNRIASN